MNTLKLIVIFLFLLFAFNSNAQLTTNADSLNLPTLKELFLSSSETLSPSSPIQKPYSVSSLPIFCKIEANLEKKTDTPIFFRLGSKAEVDRIEGKGSGIE